MPQVAMKPLTDGCNRFGLVGSGMGPIQPNRAMEISYNLNRIQGVVPPACLCIGGKMPYFMRIAHEMLPISVSSGSPHPPLFSSPMDSRISTATARSVRHPTVEQAEAGPSSSSPPTSRGYVSTCRRLFPSEEDESRSSRGRDQDGFGYSDFSPYLFRDYEARLAKRIPDLSYTRSYAPPEAAYPEQLGFNSYSALPPDDNARMPWSPGTFFRARAARVEGAEESRESRPSPLPHLSPSRMS
ncbi:hypothetical protein PIB30_048122 [Stylosanthes scabra]|uniref:Uncharacterized protein n=1 Tax=Stylosanthes scabra TaxID=79078 RepID=A0ABU6QIH0_9FABA|nr:hypothetical protein [Stylosanthes scabra]